MNNRSIASALVWLVALASAGCSSQAGSPAAPSAIQLGAGPPPSGSVLTTLSTGTRRTVTTSRQVELVDTVFASWSNEWVNLSGRIHILTQATLVDDCLPIEACLMVAVITNADGISGIGQTTGARYRGTGTSIVAAQLAHVEQDISSVVAEIELLRLRQEGAQDDSQQESQAYRYKLTVNLNKAAESYAFILCEVTFCNVG